MAIPCVITFVNFPLKINPQPVGNHIHDHKKNRRFCDGKAGGYQVRVAIPNSIEGDAQQGNGKGTR